MKRKVIKVISISITLLMILSVSSHISIAAATGTDENGLVWSDDGTNVAITGYTGSAAYLVIPDKINEHPVESIGFYAFDRRSSLISVTIPDSVTSIGYCSFARCSSLTSITIPDSVTSIDDGAFIECGKLADITLPKNITSISDSTFEDCTSLVNVSISDSVTSIGPAAFSGCSSLKSVIIPNGVTSICDFAFSLCTSLTSVTIPNSVTNIGNYAFQRCIALTSLTIPSSVTLIGTSTFYLCSSNLVIYGKPGSVVETYCKSKNINFVELPPSPTVSPTATPASTVTPTPRITPIQTIAPIITFTDLNGFDWAKEAILSMANQGILKGVGNNQFAPQKNVTRAEFATMVVKLIGYQNEVANSNFDDVHEGSWYYPFVSIAFNHSIIKGTSTHTFEPEANITRQDIAVIITRTYNLDSTNTNSTLSVFCDNGSISSYALDAVAACVNKGIIKGNPDGTFRPLNYATRAEAAVMLDRTRKL